MAANFQSDKFEENVSLIHPECTSRGSAQAQLSSSTVGEKSSKKSIKKDQKYFLFDIIVARLDIPNVTAEHANKLLVYANFNGHKLKISSSRINVLDFRTNSILEFPANPLELKQQLSANPLTLKVTAAKKVLGYGSLKWPTELLSDLEQRAGEITSSFEIELMKCDRTRTGTMLIIVRLQPKCEEYEEDNTPDGKCRNANKEIAPNDVLFVVDEKTKKSCCCSQIGIIPASDSDHDLQPKCLDLSSYRAINSQNIDNINTLAFQDPACEKVEVTTNHYQKILEVLRSKNRKTSLDKNGGMFSTIPSDTFFKANILPSNSNLCPDLEPFPPGSRAFAAKGVKQISHACSSPKLIENEPQSLRHCPLCKQNMGYLPKLAACPNCCYKPEPYFKEKPYVDSKTADDVLKEFHDKLKQNDNSVTDTCTQDSARYRCSCKYGEEKPCANCRIRKLCKDIFQPSLPATKTNEICEQKSSIVNCVSSSDSRPYLTKIFSELRDLYDIEEPKRREFELDERCEKSLNKPSGDLKHILEEKKNKRDVQTLQNDEPNATIKPKEIRKRKKRSGKFVRVCLRGYHVAYSRLKH